MSLLTIDERTATSTVLGQQRGDLALRIHGTARDGQVLRLTGNKYSVGAGAGCTLRLEEPGLRPVHLYILRGAAGDVVRRWSLDTRLNGRDFRDALLRKGDRLSLGAVELEVLEGDDQPLLPENSDLQQRVEALAEEVQELEARLRQQSQQFEIESAAWQEERSRLEGEAQEAAAGQQAAAEQLAHLETTLEQHAREWEAERQRLETEQQQVQRDFEAARLRQQERDARLAESEQELARNRETLEAREQGIQAEHEAAQRQWQQLTDSLKLVRETLESEKQQWQQRLADRQDELSGLEQALGDARGQIAEQSRQLDEARRELDEERRQYRDGRHQATEKLERREAELFHQEEELHEQRRVLKLRNEEVDELHEALRGQQQQLREEAEQLNRDRKEYIAWRSECEHEIAARRNELQHLQEELRGEKDALTHQREELAARQANLQGRLSTPREGGADALEADRRELREFEARLAYRKSVLDQQLGEWKQQRSALAERERLAHSATERHEAAGGQIEALEKELGERREEIALFEAELQTATDELRHLRTEYETAQSAWREHQQQREQLEQELELAQQQAQRQGEQLRELEESYKMQLAELSERMELRAVAADIDARPEIGDQVAADSPPSGDAMLALERLREAATRDDVDDVDEMRTADGYATFDSQDLGEDLPVDVDGPSASADRGDDVSIEDYMAQLMQRVQGKSGVPLARPATKSSQPAAPRKVSTVQPAAKKTVSPSEPADQNQKPKKPVKLAPRAAAPEQPQSLQAMRELANSSARNALDSSSRRQIAKAMRSNFIMSAGTFIGGSVLLAISGGLLSWQASLAAVCFGAAGYFAINVLKIRRRLATQSTTKAPAKAESVADNAAD